jgi:hypothetical protein
MLVLDSRVRRPIVLLHARLAFGTPPQRHSSRREIEMKQSPDTRLDALLRNPPSFHHFRGEDLFISLAEEDLRWMFAWLQPGMRSVETGCGASTIMFALSGARHTCITPSAEEVDKIRDYCRSRDISLSDVQFIIDQSEYALPGLRGQTVDLALIDGRHGFPAPFIDWFFMADLLRPDGVLVVDDLALWPPLMLSEYLRQDDRWDRIRETSRSAIFRMREKGAHAEEWLDQKFVIRRSRGTSLVSEAIYLLQRLARGELGLVWYPFGRRAKRLVHAVMGRSELRV